MRTPERVWLVALGQEVLLVHQAHQLHTGTGRGCQLSCCPRASPEPGCASGGGTGHRCPKATPGWHHGQPGPPALPTAALAWWHLGTC